MGAVFHGFKAYFTTKVPKESINKQEKMLSANDKPSTTKSNGLTSNLCGGYTAQPHSQHTGPKAYMRNHAMNSETPLQHIWIVTGPAGSGKTTVAKNLQAEMGLPFLEGDDVRLSAAGACHTVCTT